MIYFIIGIIFLILLREHFSSNINKLEDRIRKLELRQITTNSDMMRLKRK